MTEIDGDWTWGELEVYAVEQRERADEWRQKTLEARDALAKTKEARERAEAVLRELVAASRSGDLRRQQQAWRKARAVVGEEKVDTKEEEDAEE